MSHSSELGGGEFLEWHEELVQFGILFGLHHEILRVGHLALHRRDKLDAHFGSRAGQSVTGRPPRGPGQLSGV